MDTDTTLPVIDRESTTQRADTPSNDSTQPEEEYTVKQGLSEKDKERLKAILDEADIKILPVDNIPIETMSIDTLTTEIQRKTLILSCAQEVERYLENPVVTDKFGKDHEARREWETRLETQQEAAFDPSKARLLDVLNNNPLGGNSLGTAVSNALLIERLLKKEGTNPQLADKIGNYGRQAMEAIYGNDEERRGLGVDKVYDAMNTEEKIQIYQTCRGYLVKILQDLFPASTKNAA